MSKKCSKALMITSYVFALAGICCFVVKLIEATLRSAHEWAEVFVILGFVFLGVALAIVGALAVVEKINNKKNQGKAEVSDEELLAKYKTKKNK